MKENTRFVLRVTVTHVVTYILCGIVFMTLFHYDELYQYGNTKYFMRPVDSASSLAGPVFQIIRGLLFGFVLLLLKKSVIETTYGWLKLWGIIAVIGIINTPGPAPCSIEGIIYTQLPLAFHIKGAPEILIQTLLFSFMVANPSKFKCPFLHKYKIPLISALSGGVMFSVSGMILTLILGTDINAAVTDMGAFGVMFAAVLVIFAVSKWYLSTASDAKHFILPVCCYLVMGLLPTVYNYITDSPFATWLTLVINGIPVLILFLINYIADRHRSKI